MVPLCFRSPFSNEVLSFSCGPTAPPNPCLACSVSSTKRSSSEVSEREDFRVEICLRGGEDREKKGKTDAQRKVGQRCVEFGRQWGPTLVAFWLL